MKSILIGAYALSPKHGSEYGIGWNFVIGVSKYFPVKVIYGTSEGKMGSNSTLTNYLSGNRIPNVEVFFCKAGILTQAFDWLNHNVAHFFFIFALKSWHRDALKFVQKNFNPEDFELFTWEEYLDFFISFLERLNPAFVVERFTGEAPPRFLIGEGWGKKRTDQIVNIIEKRLEEIDSWQGRMYEDKR